MKPTSPQSPAHLGLSEHDFIQRYTRLRPRRDGLALIDKPNGECIFLEGRDCAVQAVKPGQCRGFPNTWNFPGWREVCEAVPVPVAAPAIARTLGDGQHDLAELVRFFHRLQGGVAVGERKGVAG